MQIVIDIPEETINHIQQDYISFSDTTEGIALSSIAHGTPLDKIRAEIDSYCSDNRDRNDGLYIAMKIIDKYREIEPQESEG